MAATTDTDLIDEPRAPAGSMIARGCGRGWWAMTRKKNDPEGIVPLATAGLSKGEWIRASLEEYAASAGPGALLPSERVLAERFGVARMTVRTAMDALELAGLIRRVHGRGAFVAHPLVTQPGVLRSFSADMRLRGLTPGTADHEITTRAADTLVAGKLGIARGDEIFAVRRVRTADDSPMALERTHLPAARFPQLDSHLADSESLYAVLSSVYGVTVDSAEQTVAIAHLTAGDARSLATDPGAPCFAITRTSRDRMGAVVEFGRSLYRGDRYQLEMHVSSETATP